MDQARDRLEVARIAFATGHLEGAVSAAYYAMLYAARAALSEDDEYARSHGGTWGLFHRRYVVTDAFDQQPPHIRPARPEDARTGRLGAIPPEPDEAKTIVEGAGDFIAEVEFA